MKDLLVILGILILCFELYRLLRGNWFRPFLKKKKNEAQLRKPHVMKPKSERDCVFCVKEKGRQGSSKPEMPSTWNSRKGRGGPIKKISTQGYFCPNPDCKYFYITDENIHALVGYGSHGKQELIRDLKCQACGKKFTSRKNTILYRLKTQSGLVEKILWLLALGVDAFALEEVFGVREITIRTWGPAHYTPELLEHLEWWRAYYHCVRYHESLKVALATPTQRMGKQQPIRYRRRTPATPALALRFSDAQVQVW